jgi:hypothetical protein
MFDLFVVILTFFFFLAWFLSVRELFGYGGVRLQDTKLFLGSTMYTRLELWLDRALVYLWYLGWEAIESYLARGWQIF